MGIIIALCSFILAIWAVVMHIMGNTVPGWASSTSLICFMGANSVNLFGVIGEYIGKIYLETKQRPRYIISERVGDFQNND